MAGGNLPSKYPPPIAFIFIFNLIVGTGVLTLPYGFNAAGIGFGLILLFIMGFLSYITATFVIEAMSVANLKLEVEKVEDRLINQIGGSTKNSGGRFVIEEKVEFGMMAEIFMGKVGQMAFSLVLIVYLVGDLAIYGVTIPDSVARLSPDGVDVMGVHVSKDGLYNIYLVIFGILMVPISCFNFQKTKYLQLVTTVTRQIALFSMIIIVVSHIFQMDEVKMPDSFFNVRGIPKLLGAVIYSFMCHHSLPGIVTPLTDKRKIYPLVAADMGFIYLVYSLLCTTAVIAFTHVINPQCKPEPGPPCQIQELYTFNFISYNFVPLAWFLQLYPVFTLSTNFPLIVITLRNNVLELFGYSENSSKFLRFFSSFILIALPLCVSAALPGRIQLLTEMTGSFAGLAIMYIFPPLLVIKARSYKKRMFGGEKNPFTSPFSHTFWIILVFTFSAALLAFSVYDVYTDISHIINNSTI